VEFTIAAVNATKSVKSARSGDCSMSRSDAAAPIDATRAAARRFLIGRQLVRLGAIVSHPVSRPRPGSSPTVEAEALADVDFRRRSRTPERCSHEPYLAG